MIIKQIQNGLNFDDIAKSFEAVYDTSLDPQERIPLHFHPDAEEIYYILSGYGIMTIADEKEEISRADVIYIPSEAQHTLLNTGNVPLRFMTVTVKVSNKKKEEVPYIR
ncbi:MAG: cupin domain-containing protein [Candidatus Methanoperedens sp.]|nr:cupin domain-containing protein [Candidatus Methanoperedens sp.]MCE8428931.1 cupin domain-containing protein [Candidatus Methanoperedens sp.]